MKRILSLAVLFCICVCSFAQINLLEKAAEQGDEDAQKYLGYAYLNGGTNGVKRNLQEAYKWYLAAANNGDAESQYIIATFKHDYYGGFKSNEDVEEFFMWMEKSAKQGYAPAQANLAFFAMQKDANAGFNLYKLAADQGYLPAYCRVGDCFLYGIGVVHNLSSAEKYYKMAIDANMPEGFMGLGYCAANREDWKLCKQYYQKAIDANIPMGYNDMAYLYADGKGVPQDFKEAHRLVDMAISMERNNLNFWDTKGEFYLKENKLEEAANLWNKIKSMNEEFAQTTDSEFCNTMRSLMDGSVDMNIAVTNASNSNTYAVIIANENYKREEKVPFAETDGKIFKEYCNKTLGILESNIKFITDATYNDIRYVTNWLKQVITANNGQAKVIFYYAGHGIPDEATKTAYLLPVDGYGSDVSTGYSLKELYDMLSGLPSQSAMVFLDACFSGTKREGDMLASARGVAIKVKGTVPKGNMVVFSAAQGDETAYPYKEQRHGMFTYYLLKKLQETKGEATLGEISDYVTSEVRKQSIVINGKMQTPTLTSSSAIGDTWRNWKLK